MVTHLAPLPTEALSVRDLCTRYGLARQSLYQRLSATSITPLKRGNQSFFSPEMVEELDRVHHLLGQGFSLRDVADHGDQCLTPDTQQTVDVVPVTGQTPDVQMTPPKPSQEAAFQMLGEIIADAVRSVSVAPPVSPLQVHRDLAEAADGGFLLTSRQVAAILGISNSTTHGWNSQEERMGFVLKRQGVGRWRVIRPADEVITDV